MIAAAPGMARVRSLITSGERPPSLDITGDVSEAAKRMSAIRKLSDPDMPGKKMTVAKYLSQVGIFGTDMTPVTEHLLKVFDEYKTKPKVVAGILSRYAELVEGMTDPRAGSLFGDSDEIATPTSDSLLTAAIDHTEKEYSLGKYKPQASGDSEAVGKPVETEPGARAQDGAVPGHGARIEAVSSETAAGRPNVPPEPAIAHGAPPPREVIPAPTSPTSPEAGANSLPQRDDAGYAHDDQTAPLFQRGPAKAPFVPVRIPALERAEARRAANATPGFDGMEPAAERNGARKPIAPPPPKQLGFGLEGEESPRAPSGDTTGTLFQRGSGRRQLTANNYGDLSQHTPTLYRETGISDALPFVDPQVHTSMGDSRAVHFADHQDMALGQGANKGVLLQFRSDGIKGVVNTDKPGLAQSYDQGMGEYKASFNPQNTYRDNLQSVTVKPDAKFTNKAEAIRFDRLMARNVEHAGWTKATNADGSVTYTKPSTDAMRRSVMQDGQPLFQRNPQTETPAFKNWFAGSKVVDEAGKPLVVYHGSRSHDPFDTFETSPDDIGIHFGTKEQSNERLEYMRPVGSETADGSHTYPAHIRLQNPLRLQDDGEWTPQTIALQLSQMPEFKGSKLSSLIRQDQRGTLKTDFRDEIRNLIKAKGYDGIVYKNQFEVSGRNDAIRRVADLYTQTDGLHPRQIPESLHREIDAAKRHKEAVEKNNGEDSYIVFDPHQIKSAIGNRGTFDPSDPNILRQNPADTKGSISWSREDGRALITLYRSADISTVAHEFAHLFRRALPSDLLAKAEAHYGITDGNWTTDHEEDFARQFERYLHDGVAPTPTLKTAFGKFRQWLGDIYGQVKNSAIGKELHPNMKALFDEIVGGKNAGDGKTATAATETAKASATAVPATAAATTETAAATAATGVGMGDTPGAVSAGAQEATAAKAQPVLNTRLSEPNGTGSMYAANFNLERMDTTDDVRQGMIDHARANAVEMEKSRGGVVSHADTLAAAKSIGLTIQQLQKGKPAGMQQSHWVASVASLITKKAEEVQAAADAYEKAPSAANESALETARSAYNVTAHAATGEIAEAGRSLNILKALRRSSNATESGAREDLFNPKAAPKTTARTFGNSNRYFTLDKAQAARQRFLEKSASPAGVLYQSAKPDRPLSDNALRDLTEIGGFHLEGGLRNYDNWAAQMKTDTQGRVSDTNLQRVWNNIKLEASDRQRTAAAPRTNSAVLIDQIARRVGRKGAADFLASVPDEVFQKLAAGADRTPDEQSVLNSAYAKAYRTYQSAKPVTQRAVINTPLNDIAKAARMQAKAEAYAHQTPESALKESQEGIAGKLSDADRAAFLSDMKAAHGDIPATVRVLRKYSRMSVGDSVTGLWKAGLLSHIGTLPKVGLAHIGMNTLEEVKRIPASLADMAYSAATGTDRQVAGLAVPAMLNAAKTGATKGIAESAILMREGEAGLKLRGVSMHAMKGLDIPAEYNANLGPFSTLANAYVNSVSRTHGAVYHVNKVYGFARSIDEQAQLAARVDAKRNGGDYQERYRYHSENPTTQMIVNAASAAEELTLQNRNAITQSIQSIKGVAASKGVKPLVDLSVPFSTVPSNILLKGLEYTGGLPLGVAQLIKRSFNKEVMTPAQQRSWSNTMGRGTTGAAAIALGTYLYQKGLITPPDSKKFIPAMLKLGGKYLPISDKAPAGTLMTIGSILASKRGDDQYKEIFNALMADAPMAESNPLTNIKDNPSGYLGQQAKSMLIPGTIQDIAGHLDPDKRVTNVPGNAKATVMDSIKSGIPVLRQSLQPKGARDYDPADPWRLRSSAAALNTGGHPPPLSLSQLQMQYHAGQISPRMYETDRRLIVNPRPGDALRDVSASHALDQYSLLPPDQQASQKAEYADKLRRAMMSRSISANDMSRARSLGLFTR